MVNDYIFDQIEIVWFVSFCCRVSDSLIIESEYSPKDGPYILIKMSSSGPRDLRKEFEEKRDKMKVFTKNIFVLISFDV